MIIFAVLIATWQYSNVILKAASRDDQPPLLLLLFYNCYLIAADGFEIFIYCVNIRRYFA